MANAHGDPKRMVRVYIAIFAALAVLTVLTVWANSLHVPRPAAIAIAAGIAIIKVCLIAMFFMHLKFEGKWIYGVVALALVAICILIFLISPDIAGILGGVRH
ncbi:MAG: hypothetical protein A3G34_08930 [Candidatus Lindowbacteria bacterium RIFCSPLOWO2_12_FULL_62_27]|nr:MAG: hypothetical protein A3G34_08930 [Candidatus Lindowbacteria bacterium RIFCSPLOWO2_12_FULL_62_27]